MVFLRFQLPYMVVVGLLGSVLLLSKGKESFGFVVTTNTRTIRHQLTFLDDYGRRRMDPHKRSMVCLDAKAKKKKKSATNQSSGGFGKVTTATKKEVVQDDYASFPRLESGVTDTLLPVTDEILQRSDLMNEVYDRLDQIYGFDNFNGIHPPTSSSSTTTESVEATSTTEQDDTPMSVYNLLSVGGNDDDESEATVGSAASTTAQSNFADLLSDIQSSTTTTTTAATTAGNTDLNDLISAAVSGDDTAAPTIVEVVAAAAEEPPTKKSSEKLNLFQLKPFSNIQVLHLDPLVVTVDQFLTDDECDKYVRFCTVPKKHTSAENMPMMISSKTVGKDKLSKSQRSSTTWYHHFKNVPELMAKASRLLGLETINGWEEPQTVRYQQSEKYTWHLDALGPSDDLQQKGGQRTATLLVYLADMGEDGGGATMFRDLGGDGDFLKVQPKKGSALLFFPSAGGIPNAPFDIRTLHSGEAVSDDATSDKWIAQLWMRENDSYKPTGPPGNSHAAANDAINAYCNNEQQ